MREDTPQSRRQRLLYLIGRSPTGNEHVCYLSGQGIRSGTFRAAIQAGEVTKTGHLYSLTDAGEAALSIT
jgi:hypothetical protein